MLALINSCLSPIFQAETESQNSKRTKKSQNSKRTKKNVKTIKELEKSKL